MDITAAVPPEVVRAEPTIWNNPHLRTAQEGFSRSTIAPDIIDQACRDWASFAPLLIALFPELATTQGRIDSPLLDIPAALQHKLGVAAPSAVLVKADSALPVTGTVKARGATYEILCHARQLAIEAGYLEPGSSSVKLGGDRCRQLFAKRRISTGSTGNLGYSVGVIGRALGFSVVVHMSHDAREWKKERLRALGANVVEHDGDYGSAVAAARSEARLRSDTYFVDDENSLGLFAGYSSAAGDLKKQLRDTGREPTRDRPLFVYLPCGVGGAPGGITFGLKRIFGDRVRCMLVEPVASPCMLIQLACGIERSVSVYDLGLDNRTEADGLAVARASMLVARNIHALVDAVVTVTDREMLAWSARAHRDMELRLEASAAAGFAALAALGTKAGDSSVRSGLHIVWTTGGSRLPDDEFARQLQRAKAAEASN